MKPESKENMGMYKSLAEYKTRENKFSLLAGKGESQGIVCIKGVGRMMAVKDSVALDQCGMTIGCGGESSGGKSQHHALSMTADRCTGEQTKLRVPTPGRGGCRDRESCLGQSRGCGKQRQASCAKGMRRWSFWVPAKACRRKSVASEGNVELNKDWGLGGSQGQEMYLRAARKAHVSKLRSQTLIHGRE